MSRSATGLIGRRVRFDMRHPRYRGLVGVVLDAFYAAGDTYDLMLEVEEPEHAQGKLTRIPLDQRDGMPTIDPIGLSDPGPYPSDTGTCVHCGLPMLRKDPAFPNRTRLCAVRRNSLGGAPLPCQPFHEAPE